MKAITKLQQDYKDLERILKDIKCPFCGYKLSEPIKELDNPAFRKMLKRELDRMIKRVKEYKESRELLDSIVHFRSRLKNRILKGGDIQW